MIRFFLLLLFISGSIAASAQSPTPTPQDENDFQSWNDATLTRKLNDNFDIVIPLTLRLGKNVSRVQETRVGFGLAMKPHRRITITPGYSFIRSRNSAGNFIRENRLTLATVVRFPVDVVGISHRSLFEYRIRQTGKSWRYRPSVTVEKPLPERWVKGMKVYVTTEPFYDSSAGRFSRNRLSLGINKSLAKNLSVDLFYLRQDDTTTSISPVHAIGTHWRIRL